jgi:hypothetical protein
MDRSEGGARFDRLKLLAIGERPAKDAKTFEL